MLLSCPHVVRALYIDVVFFWYPTTRRSSLDAEAVLPVLLITDKAYKSEIAMDMRKGDGKLHIHFNCGLKMKTYKRSLADALKRCNMMT